MQNQNQLLLKIIDTIPDLVFYRDLDGTFQACNQAYANYADKNIAPSLKPAPIRSLSTI